jgi:hypothetical protein
MSSLDSLVDLLATLADPSKFKAQLAELRAASADAKAVAKAKEDLEVARHEASEEINELQRKHDEASADTDRRLAARLVEIEAREKRVAQLEAAATEHEAKAKAVRQDAESRYRKAFG